MLLEYFFKLIINFCIIDFRAGIMSQMHDLFLHVIDCCCCYPFRASGLACFIMCATPTNGWVANVTTRMKYTILTCLGLTDAMQTL